MAEDQAAARAPTRADDVPAVDWERVARLVLTSRAMDRLEEERLVPERKVLYQFSARGHDMAQVLLGLRLTYPGDAACGYYRSRPLLLALGVDPADALGSGMGRAGGLFGRSRYRRRLQLPQSRRHARAGHEWRRRRAVYAHRRLGGGAPLPR